MRHGLVERVKCAVGSTGHDRLLCRGPNSPLDALGPLIAVAPTPEAGVTEVASVNQIPFGRSSNNSGIKLDPKQNKPTLNATNYFGENIGQTATFVSTGAAEIGFIAKSLAISKEIEPKITSAVVPESWHEPIDHGLALIKGASPTAKEFVDYVRGPKGRAVLEASGFAVPTS